MAVFVSRNESSDRLLGTVSQRLAYLLLMRYYSARVNLNTKVLDFE